jgi:hypothetical protein
VSARRARRPWLRKQAEEKIDVPIMEKSVHKQVPAVIHWADVTGIERTDDETIGTAIIYEDGTSDIIVDRDISEDAKKIVGIINHKLENYSVED